MAMTQLSVLFLLALAALASIGLFGPLPPATRVLLGMLGSVLWAVGGLSAFSVFAEAWTGSRSMEPLAIVAIGMAALTLLLSLYQLASIIKTNAGTTEQTAARP